MGDKGSDWPSPRYSRSRVIACHTGPARFGPVQFGMTGYSGRPSAFGIASAVRRTIAAERANPGERIRSSPRILEPSRRRSRIASASHRPATRLPCGGNRHGYELRIEVIERCRDDFCGDRSHRGRPAREVLHSRFQAELAEHVVRLGCEVHRRMQPVEWRLAARNRHPLADTSRRELPLRTRVTPGSGWRNLIYGSEDSDWCDA